MCLSNCQECKHLNRHLIERGDINCAIAPAYASMWQKLKSLDESTLKAVAVDSCRHFELDPSLEEKQLSLSLPFYVWKQLSQRVSNHEILETLNTTSFTVSASLTVKQWQQIIASSANPLVSNQLEQQGIERDLDTEIWLDIDSACMQAITYSPPSSILKIRFHSGLVYQYANVPHNVFLKLLDADSQDSFFSYHIKNVYSYRQI